MKMAHTHTNTIRDKKRQSEAKKPNCLHENKHRKRENPSLDKMQQIILYGRMKKK